MKQPTFHDILLEKISSQSTSEASPTAASFFSESREFAVPWLPSFIPPQISSTTSLRSYKTKPFPQDPPSVVVSAKIEIPKPPVIPEKYLHKTDLDEDGKAKWNLFEKTVGVHFGEKISRPTALSSFRKFLKTVHPDLTHKKSDHNFSSLVKIKDEFMAIFKTHSK